ncbi:MAG TPA: hypothetical protein VFU47_17245, partial [Armatimonadota bacterium]|nr:hypothetical protein [Armatimonadota bacterium]
ACIPAIQTVVTERTDTATGWTATVEETVRVGPGGVREFGGVFDVQVIERRGSAPRDASTHVHYRLRQPSPTLLRDEGYLAVFPHPNLPQSHSLLMADKSLQLRAPFDAHVLDGSGLRTVLQLWLAIAASDGCDGV